MQQRTTAAAELQAVAMKWFLAPSELWVEGKSIKLVPAEGDHPNEQYNAWSRLLIGLLVLNTANTRSLRANKYLLTVFVAMTAYFMNQDEMVGNAQPVHPMERQKIYENERKLQRVRDSLGGRQEAKLQERTTVSI